MDDGKETLHSEAGCDADHRLFHDPDVHHARRVEGDRPLEEGGADLAQDDGNPRVVKE